MKLLLIFSLVVQLVACGHRDIKTGFSGTSEKESITTRLDRWVTFYDLKLDSFIDSLPLVERKTSSFDYDYLSDTGNVYNDFFIFSPDSAHYIDLDSYSIALEKDSPGQLISNGREVDSEISLVDIKGKRKIRVLFCGTDCRPEEAYWIKNDLVYFLGFTKINKLNYPTIWAFEINNTSIQEIKTKESIDLTGKDYVETVRLKLIKFKK